MILARFLLVMASALIAGWSLSLKNVLANERLNAADAADAAVNFGSIYRVQAQSKAPEEQNYPVLIQDSADRRSAAERDWRRMLDAYSVPDVAPDLYPITHTPKSLPAAASGMKITPAQGADLEDGTGLREAVKIFLDRWRDLLDVDPDSTSLVSSSQIGGTTMLSYRQSNYPYPIVGGFGTLTVWVTPEGRLKQIDDQFIPAVDLPARPTLERTATAERVIGRTFNVNDGPGKDRAISVTDTKQIAVRQIVVLPIKKESAIEVHLAWRVDVTEATGCTVYIDAINGASLLVMPLDGGRGQQHPGAGRSAD